MMKKVTIWMLVVGLLYYLLGVSLPYIVALKRGGIVVSTSGWNGDSIWRKACINGGHLVYPNQSSENALEFGVIGKNGDMHFLTIGNKHDDKDFHSYCVNQYDNKVAIASWVDGWWKNREDKKLVVTITIYRDQVLDKRDIILPGGPYSLFISDISMKDGWLLGHMDDGFGDGGIFLLSLDDDEFILPQVGYGDHIKSGTLWKDGFVYGDRDRVIFRRDDGYQKILGDFHYGAALYIVKNRNSLAWTRLPRSFVKGYTDGLGSWRQNGYDPFLTEDDQLVLVDEELGGVTVTPVSGGDSYMLVKTKKALDPVYFNGKIYWTEKTINLSFPFQLILHKLFRSGTPIYEQTHLFAKEVSGVPSGCPLAIY